MSCPAGKRHVCQFPQFGYAAQQQAATAHVAAPCKFGRKSEPVTEYGSQCVEILVCGDTAQQDDLAALTQLTRQLSGALRERFLKAFLSEPDLHLCKLMQVLQMKGFRCLHEPPTRGDDNGSRNSGRRERKSLAVIQLATKVEAA